MHGLKTWAGVAAIAVLAISGAPAPAAAQSAWEQISKAGKMRFGIMPAREPYMWQEKGEWKGFTIEMAEQIAEALANENALGRKIEIEYVPTTWATFVLDLQANKVDAFLGASITEERKKAVDMFGPLYGLAHVMLNREGFNPGNNWADYNKPEIKIASVTGTTDEAAARKCARTRRRSCPFSPVTPTPWSVRCFPPSMRCARTPTSRRSRFPNRSPACLRVAPLARTATAA